MANESTWSVAGTRPLPVFTGSSECWAFYETSGVPPAINIALGWVELHIGRQDAGGTDVRDTLVHFRSGNQGGLSVFGSLWIRRLRGRDRVVRAASHRRGRGGLDSHNYQGSIGSGRRAWMGRTPLGRRDYELATAVEAAAVADAIG